MYWKPSRHMAFKIPYQNFDYCWHHTLRPFSTNGALYQMDSTRDESKCSIWLQLWRKVKTFSYLTVPSWSSESRTDLQDVVLTPWRPFALCVWLEGCRCGRPFLGAALRRILLTGKERCSRADACRALLNYSTARWQVFRRPDGGSVLTPSLSLWLRTWVRLRFEIYIHSYQKLFLKCDHFGIPWCPIKSSFIHYTCVITLINLQNTF